MAGLHQPLLRRPAIESLNILIRAITHRDGKPENLFPQLFRGLGKMEKEYTIRLREGAKPFTLNTPPVE